MSFPGKRAILPLLFLLLFAAPAAAWDSFVGQEPCEFVAAQMEQDDETASLMIASFITGANYAAGRSVDTDVERMASWVRDYCARHPAERFLDALIRLDESLDPESPPEEAEKGEK